MIYLDNCATTAVDPGVLNAMIPFFTEIYGNAASKSHLLGRTADSAVQHARSQVADLMGVQQDEIVFTSGATESINLALKGVMDAYKMKGRHLITMKTEHKAVLDSCDSLHRQGFQISFAELNKDGIIDLDHFQSLVRKDTVMASIMWANNETGVIQPIEQIGRICAEHGLIFFSDATQAFGKIKVYPKVLGVHLLAFSGHKVYGPKGVGGLYLSRKAPRIKLTAQIDGGGHEKGFRSGTHNVPGIVGIGAAASIASAKMQEEYTRIESYRNTFESYLLEHLELCSINGHKENRLPGVSNLKFELTNAEQVLSNFESFIAAATGSACSSANLEPSHVLTAYGLKSSQAKSSLRFSFGRFNHWEEVEKAAEIVQEAVQRLRSESPVWQMYKKGVDLGELIL
jgi:cysteine desulfurase